MRGALSPPPLPQAGEGKHLDRARETAETVTREMPEFVSVMKDFRRAGFDVRWRDVRYYPPGAPVVRGVSADVLLANSRAQAEIAKGK